MKKIKTYTILTTQFRSETGRQGEKHYGEFNLYEDGKILGKIRTEPHYHHPTKKEQLLIGIQKPQGIQKKELIYLTITPGTQRTQDSEPTLWMVQTTTRQRNTGNGETYEGSWTDITREYGTTKLEGIMKERGIEALLQELEEWEAKHLEQLHFREEKIGILPPMAAVAGQRSTSIITTKKYGTQNHKKN